MPETTLSSSRRLLILWLVIALLVVVADHASKWLILHHFTENEAKTILPFFKLVLVYNPGAAFSFLASQPGWQRWFFILLSSGVSLILIRILAHHAQQRLVCVALSLVLGGAIGNLIDRIVHGAVVDFLYFHIGRYAWPAFNIADSAITTGAVLLIISQLFHTKPPHPQT